MMYDDTIAEILYARTCNTAENAKMIRGIISVDITKEIRGCGVQQMAI